MGLMSFLQSMLCSSSRKEDSPEKTVSRNPFGDEFKDTEKKLLVLDLDETLLHTQTESFDSSTRQIILPETDKRIQLFVSPRPYLNEFLEEMSKYYHIIIFTKSPRQYALDVLIGLDIYKYIQKLLYRRYCKRGYFGLIKDLTILGAPLRKVVLIDDTVDNTLEQPENALIIPRYEGKKDDDTLLKLIPFLKYLAFEYDVRDVEAKFVNFLVEQKSKEKERRRFSLKSTYEGDSTKRTENSETLSSARLNTVGF